MIEIVIDTQSQTEDSHSACHNIHNITYIYHFETSDQREKPMCKSHFGMLTSLSV